MIHPAGISVPPLPTCPFVLFPSCQLLPTITHYEPSRFFSHSALNSSPRPKGAAHSGLTTVHVYSVVFLQVCVLQRSSLPAQGSGKISGRLHISLLHVSYDVELSSEFQDLVACEPLRVTWQIIHVWWLHIQYMTKNSELNLP